VAGLKTTEMQLNSQAPHQTGSHSNKEQQQVGRLEQMNVMEMQTDKV